MSMDKKIRFQSLKNLISLRTRSVFDKIRTVYLNSIKVLLNQRKSDKLSISQIGPKYKTICLRSLIRIATKCTVLTIFVH